MLPEGYRELLDQFAEYLEKQEMLSRLTEADFLHGYSYAEIHCIGMIGEMENPTASKIAERMKMTRSAISKMTKRQIKAKLVEKYSLDTNKKEVYFRLTEAGWKLYQEHENRHRLWEQRDTEFFQHHSAEELNRMLQFMREFNQYLRVQIDKINSQQVTG